MTQRIFSDFDFLRAIEKATRQRGAGPTELIAAIKCSKALFKKRLAPLIDLGLVEREGQRRGYVLTPLGRERLKKGR